MNQVFQSLRGEFELDASYSGRTILGTTMNTIKVQLVVGGLVEMCILLLKYLLRSHE